MSETDFPRAERYLSTRGGEASGGPGFSDVLLTGLAPDGGLYLPARWPTLGDMGKLAGRPFGEVAKAVLGAFAPELSEEALSEATAPYARFGHDAVTPLVQTGPDDFLLELFHGPTLAFKDVAMQMLGRLFERTLAERGREMMVVVATSGDTGGAAVEALAGLPSVKLCVLHPEGRISEVQRRLMTTSGARNVMNLAVEGSFDDCQRLVKALFADKPFAAEIGLGAVNSINWARIVAQSVYFVTASLSLSRSGEPVHFVVPTGNFGDAFSGYAASRLGAPVGRIVVATNENDVLDRLFRTGRQEARPVRPTMSPSMDIQAASNIERAIFEAAGRDGASVAALMAAQGRGEGYALPDEVCGALSARYSSYAVSEADTASAMAQMRSRTGLLVDPHTAIGLHAAGRAREEGLQGPVVTLATAHPAKFPDAVEAATAIRPGLPPRLDALMSASEDMASLPAELDALQAVLRGLQAR